MELFRSECIILNLLLWSLWKEMRVCFISFSFFLPYSLSLSFLFSIGRVSNMTFRKMVIWMPFFLYDSLSLSFCRVMLWLWLICIWSLTDDHDDDNGFLLVLYDAIAFVLCFSPATRSHIFIGTSLLAAIVSMCPISLCHVISTSIHIKWYPFESEHIFLSFRAHCLPSLDLGYILVHFQNKNKTE